MLLLAVAIPLVALCCLAAGHAMLRLLGATRLFEDPADEMVTACWLGVGILSTGFEWMALAGPLGPLRAAALAIALATAGVLSGFRWNVWRKFSASFGAAICGLFLLVVVRCAALPVDAYDTGLYHQPAVSLLSQYGLVRGIAWFQLRLGFTSSWLAFAAAFNHGFLAGRVAPVASGLLQILVGFHWLSKLERLAKGSMRGPDWFLLLVYPGLVLGAWLWHHDLSISPDPVAWFLTALAAWAMLLRDRDAESARREFRAAGFGLPAVFACLGFAVKISALPVVLAAFLYAAVQGSVSRNLRAWAALLGVCSLPVLGALAANVETSGCPLYPSPLACLDTDWSVGPAFAATAAGIVRDYSREGFAAPRPAGGFEWMRGWIADKQKAALLLLTLLGTLAALARLTRSRGAPWVLLLSWLGLAVLFAVAPNPRFGLAYFFIPPGVAALVWGRDRNPSRAPHGGAVLVAAALALMALGFGADLRFRGLSLVELFARDAILPARLPSRAGELFHRFNRFENAWLPLRLEQCRIGALRFTRPTSSDQCWNVPLCTADNPFLDPHFQPRDSDGSIRGGFVKTSPR